MSETIFTKIINKEIPADILYEDDMALAFKDINPQAPVHFLVIPKKPIATVNDIQNEDREIVGHLSLVAAKVANDLGVAEQGFRTVMNCNEFGGQTVYHIHLHVLAGKPLGWPPYTEDMKKHVE
ncbi:MAG: histidine triad nucleotide-binding protein [Alteromonas sp.]|jgi:histidine triad (HIT) family protein|uniref:histidine triad nucleotide-binding protein n=1 Tax=unclassified Alteromonas TaxID=2614992 RepID=UPI00090311EA|nr:MULTISPECIES: histidine triad nucleotide-binding protein [unclassified Alteromonas]APE04919.1 histidine triad nucleotide-binding protein [Alteromonas sp. RW2A1]AUC87326.1 histidine triad nucleotide-binding protein [Alteromonas sp. MB-3u-76]MAI65006.1 histidine triad nucleotide-binding protein [Alteromonas sp.]